MHCKSEEEAKKKLKKKPLWNDEAQRKDMPLQNQNMHQEEHRHSFTAICLELPAPPHSVCCHSNSCDLFSQTALWHVVLQWLGLPRPHETRSLLPSSTGRTTSRIPSILQLILQSSKIQENVYSLYQTEWSSLGGGLSDFSFWNLWRVSISHFPVSCVNQPSLALAEECGSDRSTDKVMETAT